MPSTSSSNATGDMVQRSAPAEPSNLTLRVISALVLGPAALVITVLGWPYFGLLATTLGGILVWEWARICAGGELTKAGYLSVAIVVAGLSAATLGEYLLCGWIVLAGAMAVAVVSRREAGREGLSLWYALGVVYTAIPCLAYLWMRSIPDQGLAIILWILCAVWATDIGAYAAGRTIGGPKLAPRVSPNKTWAGLGGGVAAAILTGVIAGLLVPWAEPWELAVVSGLLAVVAQGGDLFESGVKRHFGVKDSSNLIAGHGGFLDRLDGVLAAGAVMAVLLWARGGVF